MNGTSGISTNMAQATFAPLDMSVRDSRSIQMRMTARGWRKQRRSSMTFFMSRILWTGGLAWSLRRTGSADAHRRAGRVPWVYAVASGCHEGGMGRRVGDRKAEEEPIVLFYGRRRQRSEAPVRQSRSRLDDLLDDLWEMH